MLSSVFVRTHTSVDKHTPICITNVLENGGPILLHFQSRLPAFVYVCLCVLATKPITHSIRKRFRYGPESVHGAWCGWRGAWRANT